MSPGKLWLKSLFLVLGGPILGWLFLSIFFGVWAYPRPTLGAMISYGLVAAFVCALGHFVLYLAFGLPIFYFIDRGASHTLCNKVLLLCLTFTLILITYTVILHSSRNYATLNSIVSGAFIVSLYATWSAACARRYKLKLENKMLRLKVKA
jgi:hypothetical protein